MNLSASGLPSVATSSAATSAANASVSEGLDPQALQRLRQLDPSGSNHLLDRVADAFESSTARLLPQLDSALEARDMAGVKHVAHTLKSSSASIGALKLSALCAGIEGMIQRDDREGFDVRVAEMRSEILKISDSLRELLRRAA